MCGFNSAEMEVKAFEAVQKDELTISYDRIPYMKKSRVLGIILLIVLAASLSIRLIPRFLFKDIASVRHSIPESVQHLPLKQVRHQGNITIAQISVTSQIDGFPCAAGWVHFNQFGRLRAFFLAEESMIQGNQIPKGTWVQLDDGLNLRYCSFPEKTNIQGYVCNGGFGGAEGVSTAFYPSGRLKEFYSPENIVIQGIPCKADALSPIYLFEDGNLKEFTLSEAAVIKGRNMLEGQTVTLNEFGEVESVRDPSLWRRTRNWARKFFA